MDPQATWEALQDAFQNSDQDAIAEHTRTIIQWLERGGAIPELGPGRYSGCPWWVLYTEYWTSCGDGEVLETFDEHGNGRLVVLHPSSLEARVIFNEPDAMGGFVFEIDEVGFLYTYGVTLSEAADLRHAYTPADD